MERGTVKWFDEERGFGFIITDGSESECFVHSSNVNTLNKLLEKGERVEFELKKGQRGMEAINVSILEP